jgi:hypothetical protein
MRGTNVDRIVDCGGGGATKFKFRANRPACRAFVEVTKEETPVPIDDVTRDL